MWDLPTRKAIAKVTGHHGWVRGLCYHPSGEYFFSVSKYVICVEVNSRYRRHRNYTNLCETFTLFFILYVTDLSISNRFYKCVFFKIMLAFF